VTAPTNGDLATCPLTVVLMAYDEAATLPDTANEAVAVLATLGLAGAEILIVDDGSRDETPQISAALAESLPRCRVIRHDPNQGLGAVYRTGLREARGTFVTFFPADGQFPASIIADFWPVTHDMDLILGVFAVDPRTRGQLGRVLSALERTAYRVLFGRLPEFRGVFMLRTSVLTTMPLVSDGRGWAIVMELLVRCRDRGIRITSRPTPLRPRRAGHSKVNNVRTIVANLRQLAGLRARLAMGGGTPLRAG
jgi:glycosyltransferase involved in cell wall biosynthesis